MKTAQNSLEYPARAGKPCWKPHPKVTIAIGLICDDQIGGPFKRPAIFLASDSQNTRGAAKNPDAKKISIVEFSDGQALVAQCGLAELAEKAIDAMRKKAASRSVQGDESVEMSAKEAVREIRNHLVEINKDCNRSDDEWKRYFGRNYFELLIAYYHKRTPHLFTIDVDWCLPLPVRSRFKAIGIGRDLGEFLLREYSQSDPVFQFGYPIAVSVVEKTIANVDGCGIPTQVGLVFPMPEYIARDCESSKRPYPHSMAKTIEPKFVEITAAELKRLEIKSVKNKNKELLALLKRAGKLWRLSVENEVKIQQANISKQSVKNFVKGLGKPPQEQ